MDPRASSHHSVVIYPQQQVLKLDYCLIYDINFGEDVPDLLRLLIHKMKLVLDLHFILLLEPELPVLQRGLHLLKGFCDFALLLVFELFQVLPARLEVAVQLRVLFVVAVDGLEEVVQVAFHFFGCVFVCEDEVVLCVVDDAFSTEAGFIITAEVLNGLIFMNFAVSLCCDISVIDLSSRSKLIGPLLLFFKPNCIICKILVVCSYILMISAKVARLKKNIFSELGLVVNLRIHSDLVRRLYSSSCSIVVILSYFCSEIQLRPGASSSVQASPLQHSRLELVCALLYSRQLLRWPWFQPVDNDRQRGCRGERVVF